MQYFVFLHKHIEFITIIVLYKLYYIKLLCKYYSILKFV